MQWNGKTVYVDPVGGGKPFADLPKPDLVLVTHIHFDHFDPATLEAVMPAGGRTVMVAPKTVAEKIPETLRGKTTVKVLANGEKTEAAGIAVEAVPAYNTTPGKEKFHPKGRDNGYVLTMGGKRVYIAGDTEDTAEMRALKGIDVAFLPMNLPYTMSVREGGGRDPAVQAQDRLPLSLPQRRRDEGGLRAAQEARRKRQRRGDPGAGVVSGEVGGGRGGVPCPYPNALSSPASAEGWGEPWSRASLPAATWCPVVPARRTRSRNCVAATRRPTASRWST